MGKTRLWLLMKMWPTESAAEGAPTDPPQMQPSTSGRAPPAKPGLNRAPPLGAAKLLEEVHDKDAVGSAANADHSGKIENKRNETTHADKAEPMTADEKKDTGKKRRQAKESDNDDGKAEPDTGNRNKSEITKVKDSADSKKP